MTQTVYSVLETALIEILSCCIAIVHIKYRRVYEIPFLRHTLSEIVDRTHYYIEIIIKIAILLNYMLFNFNIKSTYNWLLLIYIILEWIQFISLRSYWSYKMMSTVSHNSSLIWIINFLNSYSSFNNSIKTTKVILTSHIYNSNITKCIHYITKLWVMMIIILN